MEDFGTLSLGDGADLIQYRGWLVTVSQMQSMDAYARLLQCFQNRFAAVDCQQLIVELFFTLIVNAVGTGVVHDSTSYWGSMINAFH